MVGPSSLRGVEIGLPLGGLTEVAGALGQFVRSLKVLYALFLSTYPGQLVLLALYYLWLSVKIHGVLKLHTGHGGPVLMV